MAPSSEVQQQQQLIDSLYYKTFQNFFSTKKINPPIDTTDYKNNDSSSLQEILLPHKSLPMNYTNGADLSPSSFSVKKNLHQHNSVEKDAAKNDHPFLSLPLSTHTNPPTISLDGWDDTDINLPTENISITDEINGNHDHMTTTENVPNGNTLNPSTSCIPFHDQQKTSPLQQQQQPQLNHFIEEAWGIDHLPLSSSMENNNFIVTTNATSDKDVDDVKENKNINIDIDSDISSPLTSPHLYYQMEEPSAPPLTPPPPLENGSFERFPVKKENTKEETNPSLSKLNTQKMESAQAENYSVNRPYVLNDSNSNFEEHYPRNLAATSNDDHPVLHLSVGIEEESIFRQSTPSSSSPDTICTFQKFFMMAPPLARTSSEMVTIDDRSSELDKKKREDKEESRIFEETQTHIDLQSIPFSKYEENFDKASEAPIEYMKQSFPSESIESGIPVVEDDYHYRESLVSSSPPVNEHYKSLHDDDDKSIAFAPSYDIQLPMDSSPVKKIQIRHDEIERLSEEENLFSSKSSSFSEPKDSTVSFDNKKIIEDTIREMLNIPFSEEKPNAEFPENLVPNVNEVSSEETEEDEEEDEEGEESLSQYSSSKGSIVLLEDSARSSEYSDENSLEEDDFHDSLPIGHNDKLDNKPSSSHILKAGSETEPDTQTAAWVRDFDEKEETSFSSTKNDNGDNSLLEEIRKEDGLDTECLDNMEKEIPLFSFKKVALKDIRSTNNSFEEFPNMANSLVENKIVCKKCGKINKPLGGESIENIRFCNGCGHSLTEEKKLYGPETIFQFSKRIEPSPVRQSYKLSNSNRSRGMELMHEKKDDGVKKRDNSDRPLIGAFDTLSSPTGISSPGTNITEYKRLRKDKDISESYGQDSSGILSPSKDRDTLDLVKSMSALSITKDKQLEPVKRNIHSIIGWIVISEGSREVIPSVVYTIPNSSRDWGRVNGNWTQVTIFHPDHVKIKKNGLKFITEKKEPPSTFNALMNNFISWTGLGDILSSTSYAEEYLSCWSCLLLGNPSNYKNDSVRIFPPSFGRNILEDLILFVEENFSSLDGGSNYLEERILLWHWLIDASDASLYSEQPLHKVSDSKERNWLSFLRKRTLSNIPSPAATVLGKLNRLLLEKNVEALTFFCKENRLSHLKILFTLSQAVLFQSDVVRMISESIEYLNDCRYTPGLGLNENIKQEVVNVDDDDFEELVFRIYLIFGQFSMATEYIKEKSKLFVKRRWKSILLHALDIVDTRENCDFYRNFGDYMKEIQEMSFLCQFCYLLTLNDKEPPSTFTTPIFGPHNYMIDGLFSKDIYWKMDHLFSYLTARIIHLLPLKGNLPFNDMELPLIESMIRMSICYWEFSGEFAFLFSIMKASSHLTKKISWLEKITQSIFLHVDFYQSDANFNDENRLHSRQPPTVTTLSNYSGVRIKDETGYESSPAVAYQTPLSSVSSNVQHQILYSNEAKLANVEDVRGVGGFSLPVISSLESDPSLISHLGPPENLVVSPSPSVGTTDYATMPAPIPFSPTSVEEESIEDLGFGNRKSARSAQEFMEEIPSSDGTDQKVEKSKRKDTSSSLSLISSTSTPSTSSSLFDYIGLGRLFKRNSPSTAPSIATGGAPKIPIRANLGEENQFVYNEKLKRWIRSDEDPSKYMRESLGIQPPPIILKSAFDSASSAGNIAGTSNFQASPVIPAAEISIGPPDVVGMRAESPSTRELSRTPTMIMTSFEQHPSSLSYQATAMTTYITSDSRSLIEPSSVAMSQQSFPLSSTSQSNIITSGRSGRKSKYIDPFQLTHSSK